MKSAAFSFRHVLKISDRAKRLRRLNSTGVNLQLTAFGKLSEDSNL